MADSFRRRIQRARRPLTDRERQADRLVRAYPELGKKNCATEVVGIAADLARRASRPELGNAPIVWGLVYLMGKHAADHGEMTVARALALPAVLRVDADVEEILRALGVGFGDWL